MQEVAGVLFVKIAWPGALKCSPGQAIITIKIGKNSIDNICRVIGGSGVGENLLKSGLSKIGKNFIDNICPLKGNCPLNIVSQNNKKYSFFREKVGGEKGGGRRLWECGKPVGFSIISMAGARGERGR